MIDGCVCVKGMSSDVEGGLIMTAEAKAFKHNILQPIHTCGNFFIWSHEFK